MSVKIKEKKEADSLLEKEGEDVEVFSDKLDVYKFIASIGISGFKERVREDFVLASLNEDKKEWITEMYDDAMYTMKLYQRLIRCGYDWSWNEKLNKWEKIKLSVKDIQTIKLSAKETFDLYMNKIYMHVTLNRNVEDNQILKIMSGIHEKEEKLESNEGVLSNLQSQLEDNRKNDNEKVS